MPLLQSETNFTDHCQSGFVIYWCFKMLLIKTLMFNILKLNAFISRSADEPSEVKAGSGKKNSVAKVVAVLPVALPGLSSYSDSSDSLSSSSDSEPDFSLSARNHVAVIVKQHEAHHWFWIFMFYSFTRRLSGTLTHTVQHVYFVCRHGFYLKINKNSKVWNCTVGPKYRAT